MLLSSLYNFAASNTRLLLNKSFSSTPISQAGYKLKSHSGAKKRWRSAGTEGKFKRAKAYRSHLNVTKAPGRVNKLGLTAYSTVTQTAKLNKKLLPYGSP